MRHRSLLNMGWMILSNAIVALSKWLIIIIIARELNVVEVGQYSLAFAVTAPLALLVQMKLRPLYITDENNQFNNYLNIRILSNFLALIFMAIVGYFFYHPYFTIIIIVGISKLLDLHSDMYYSIPHKNNNLIFIGKLMVLKNILLLIIFYLSIIFSQSLIIAMCGIILFQLIFLLFIEKKIIKINFQPKNDRASLVPMKEILKLSIPLGIVAMIYSVNTNIPRYFLEYFESATVLGYFSAIMYIVTISNLFQVALSQTFMPKMSSLYNERKYLQLHRYLWRKMMLYSFFIGIIMICIVFMFDKEILTLLYGSEYAEYALVFRLAIISIFFSMFSGNLDTALISIKAIKSQPKILIENFFVTAILSYFLVKNYGIYGTGIALILSNIILLGARMRLYYLTMKKHQFIDQNKSEGLNNESR